MKINNKIQKLMPHGVELIIQGRTTRINDIDIKLIIRKRFSGKLQADYWYGEQKANIKDAIARIESISNRKEDTE